MRWRHLVLPLGLLMVATSCGIPRDMAGTTDQIIERGDLRAAEVAGSQPSNPSAGNGAGCERAAVDAFGEALGVDVVWTSDSEHSVIDQVERGNIDMAVGGISTGSPWGRGVALSAPIVGSGSNAGVAAIRSGENHLVLTFDRFLGEWDC